MNMSLLSSPAVLVKIPSTIWWASHMQNQAMKPSFIFMEYIYDLEWAYTHHHENKVALDT